MNNKRIISLLIAVLMVMGLCSPVLAAEGEVEPKYVVGEADDQGIILVTQEDGKPTLSIHEDSGVAILTGEDGYAYKDLNKNGVIDPYEDWSLETSERADDLAQQMIDDDRYDEDGVSEGIKSIAGLMLYSSHTGISTQEPSEATLTALTDEYLRHVLVTTIDTSKVNEDLPEDEQYTQASLAATWSNNVQAYAESVLWGIPANNSSDPRHTASASDAEYNNEAGDLSIWPDSIGLAATFDEDLVEEAGMIHSAEYRALGIATALSPQIDTATDPRWYRLTGTFGEDTQLSTDLARAFVDGFQTDEETGGWGYKSVNAMVKHWPGGGSGEGGRDAHYNYGKFAVYPGDNFDAHLKPFTEGAFNLKGDTEMASAVMPYYTISFEQDDVYGENVGNSYSRYMITDLLRGEYEYTGVVCTDWNIVYDVNSPWSFGGMCWGVEDMTVTERFILLLETGVDQFGGVDEIENIILAYKAMVADPDRGQAYADAQMKQHAVRLLTNIFNVGLFEAPYLDPQASAEEVGNVAYMAAGYEAQQKSVVMLKNTDDVISADGLSGKIYVDDTDYTISNDFFSGEPKKSENYGEMTDEVKANYESYLGDQYTDDIEEADAVIIVLDAPEGGSGYSKDDYLDGNNGYLPISLQYSSYTATKAREESIAANPNFDFGTVEEANFGMPTGEVYEVGNDVDNRSYKDKTYENEGNLATLDHYNSIVESVDEDVPVIVYVRATNPMVWSEIEPAADAIVLGYTIQNQAALDVITGKVEPSAMLPVQQPRSMDEVEKQYEDVGRDMKVHVDENGNYYDFGFGLNWSGVIGVDTEDARYDKYVLQETTLDPYVEGYEDDTFRGEDAISRGEAAAVIYRILEDDTEREITGESPFSDVTEDDWFHDYVVYLAEQEIIEGYEDGTFKPDEPIDREEFVTLVVRVMDLDELDTDDIVFGDVSPDRWSAGYINRAYDEGWIDGYPVASALDDEDGEDAEDEDAENEDGENEDGEDEDAEDEDDDDDDDDDENGDFLPENQIKRGEAVKVANRALERYVDADGLLEDFDNPYTDVDDESSWYYYDVLEASIGHKAYIKNGVQEWTALTNATVL